MRDLREYSGIQLPLEQSAFLHEMRPSREMISAMLLQGLISNGGSTFMELKVEGAVEAADLLIAELKRTKK